MEKETIKLIIEFKDNYNRIMFKAFFDKYESDLYPTDQMTLMYLYMDGSMSLKAMSRCLNIEKGSMTTVAKRLIDQSLVDRIPDDMDRRSSILTLTEKGKGKVEEWLTSYVRFAEERFERLTGIEKQSLLSAVTMLNAFLKDAESKE